MATVEQGLQAQIRNIEATCGKPMSDGAAIIAASGLTGHTDAAGMLKNDYGMTHGAARRVWLAAREQAAEAAAARPAATRPAPGTREGRPASAPSMTPC